MSSSTSSIPPLPAELILHILHLAYPLYAEDDYTGRSRDVLRCCLVSKQWKELAEPVLWQSITITSGTQLDELTRKAVEKRRLTRSLAFFLPTELAIPAAAVRNGLRLFPEAQHVRIAGHVDPSPILDDKHLRLSSFACLPRRTQPSLSSLLDVVEIDVGDDLVDADTFFPSGFRNVLVAVRHSHFDWSDPFYIPINDPFPPSHLRLVEDPISWPALDKVFLLPHCPESLFLPLLPPSSSTQNGPDDSAREAFLKRCKNEGVEVRWYRPAKEEWREVGCREFRKYVEERKRREEAGV
ncbi:hypothetical protein JCM8097_005711 [Rhodosporidiobolus ruineniae]